MNCMNSKKLGSFFGLLIVRVILIAKYLISHTVFENLNNLRKYCISVLISAKTRLFQQQSEKKMTREAYERYFLKSNLDVLQNVLI